MSDRPIQVGIADDDPGMRLVMQKIVERAEGFSLAFSATNGEELLRLFDEKKPEVLLLDVEMPELTGVECARIIFEKNPKTVIIFATAHESYMADAFSVYAFDYLVKPFKLDRAMRTFMRVRERLASPADMAQEPPKNPASALDRIMIKHKDGVSFVHFDDLLLVQREDRSTVLYCRGDVKYVTNIPLGEMEEKLESGPFIRTHKSYIVNTAHIDSILPYGRWTYIIKLRGTKCDALITHEKFEELQKTYG